MHVRTVAILLTGLWLMTGCEQNEEAQAAFEHAINYTEFSPNWLERYSIVKNATLVRTIDGPQIRKGDTADYWAWRFVFEDISLPDRDSGHISRDYEIFIDATTGNLLELRSPPTCDSVYAYNRERDGYPAFAEGRVPDTGVITFVKAINGFTDADLLQAEQIRATLIHSGPVGRSPSMWDIAAVGVYEIHFKRRGPRESIKALHAMMDSLNLRQKYTVTHSVNARTGVSGSCLITGTFEKDTTANKTE